MVVDQIIASAGCCDGTLESSKVLCIARWYVCSV
jgi:hypothetical protein